MESLHKLFVEMKILYLTFLFVLKQLQRREKELGLMVDMCSKDMRRMSVKDAEFVGGECMQKS